MICTWIYCLIELASKVAFSFTVVFGVIPAALGSGLSVLLKTSEAFLQGSACPSEVI